MKKALCFLSLLWLGLLIQLPAQSLTPQLAEEEQHSLEAIALYPDSIRDVILEACLRPEVIVRLESMQARSSESFQSILMPYDRQTQEAFWEITRYPGLLEALAGDGKKSVKEINAILVNYPEDIHNNALAYGRNEYATLRRIYDLNLDMQAAFDVVLADYSPSVQQTFQTLLTLPEVMGILSENMRMTILLGDHYRRSPEATRKEMDSLNIVVANQNAAELEDWKRTLEENPEALRELEAAADEYAGEYSSPVTVERTVVVNNYVWSGPYWYPYRYWYGYPWWYDAPHWYPYPYWYHWGYYYGPGGGIVIIGLPSWHFCHWYFHYPRHHYHWYNLSDCFVGYHQRHRNSASGLGRAVNSWENQNRDQLPRGWMGANGRPDRFREFGKFGMDLEAQNAKHPGNPITPDEYLRRNVKKYPSLAPAVKPSPTKDPVSTQPGVTPKTQPPVDLPKPKTPPSKEPVTRPNWTKPKVTVDKPSTQPRVPIPKARDYHRDNWQKYSPPQQRTITPRRTVTPPRRTTTVTPGKTKISPRRK